ncbi:MAG: histidinol-phosphate transaminase [Ginsengibacter sp.]
MEFNLQKIVRKNIKELKPYSSARHEYDGKASVFLDANENSLGSPLPENFNRYPDPLQRKLKSALSGIKKVSVENMFIGNGSDEVIDLAYRIFCNPAQDSAIICPPTYGMYQVSAGINDVNLIRVPLTGKFQPDTNAILKASSNLTKLLFICSPNNPTGNNMDSRSMETLLQKFPGVVIIDEAYIDFSDQESLTEKLSVYPNLIVMQTLSKAWGLASLRLGLAFASAGIIDLFNKVKPPYNINQASQELALKALKNMKEVNNRIQILLNQRDHLNAELLKIGFVEKIFESDANFLLVKVKDADALYTYLVQHKIIVRNRSREPMCEGCLRVTVGTPDENVQLINTLKLYQ